MLRAVGEDAASFLQGQFTNDLRGLPAAGSIYGLWLSVKGKVMGDSFVVQDAAEGAFWIVSYFSPAAVIRERLESHIIADDVTVDDVTADWSGVSTWAGAAESTRGDPGFQFGGRRSRAENNEWLFPSAIAETARSRFASMRELDPDEVARLRIDAGIPAIPADVGPGDLPNEGGLECSAISYTKGCYLGQEVMARLKSMGQVRRRLLRVEGDGNAIPPLPAGVFVGARQAGELRSAAGVGADGFIGLAMLSLLQVKVGTALALSPDGPAVLRWRDAS